MNKNQMHQIFAHYIDNFEKAKVVRLDEAKEDVVLELIEAAVPIPVTVKGDQIRLIQREAE